HRELHTWRLLLVVYDSRQQPQLRPHVRVFRELPQRLRVCRRQEWHQQQPPRPRGAGRLNPGKLAVREDERRRPRSVAWRHPLGLRAGVDDEDRRFIEDAGAAGTTDADVRSRRAFANLLVKLKDAIAQSEQSANALGHRIRSLNLWLLVFTIVIALLTGVLV